MKYKKLTSEEERVIINKGTEMPFTGKYLNFNGKGTYVCKKCGSHLYHSADKFESHCDLNLRTVILILRGFE